MSRRTRPRSSDRPRRPRRRWDRGYAGDTPAPIDEWEETELQGGSWFHGLVWLVRQPLWKQVLVIIAAHAVVALIVFLFKLFLGLVALIALVSLAMGSR